ncbi:PAS domain-containing protein [Siminovitchia acidinfaciens]|uniref:HTH-type transcriptional regulatory protein TyrR n=1 Tax=Siminovitchia acidinfaciens TaxID=2321395 RepID=A0A429XZA6_9BACI|nr:sigma 54-interacting transcriptional regulator [Siminovitchia acidinfaciens]RST74139.1 PAS domain-containing protein [Siminovitchia acidinfaciens]
MQKLTDIQFEFVLDQLPLGVMVINKKGTIVYCNQTASDLLNLPTASIIHNSFVHLFSLEEKDIFNDPSDGSDCNIKIKFNHKLFSLHLRKNKKTGDIISTFKPVSDINKTTSKENQTGLVDLPIDDILNSCQDEIFITNSEGKALFVNSVGKSLYGLKPEEMVGKDVDRLVQKGLFSPSLFPVVKKRKEKVSMIQRTIEGKTAHVIANPVFDPNGEITHIVFTGRDITEIKNLRKEIERNETLVEVYRSELEHLKPSTPPKDLIAISSNMRKVVNVASKVAQVDSTILITGESGVGKGVIAKFIHDKSPRNKQPFVQINCGAIPESLIESELFGYHSGAFTGANAKGMKGLFEQANGGTIFLDEIGEMPLNLQVKLLKVLQEKEVQPIGSSETIKVDIRIIAATNKDLREEIEKNKFREDLYYRLSVVPIHIPPLRERPEDISYMIDFFLDKMNKKYNRANTLSLELINTLVHYNWPGNVRELENLIERLVVTSESNQISLHDLPENFKYKTAENTVIVNDVITLKQAKEELEEQLIRKAYGVHNSSYKVADLLGINQSTAIRKINKYIKAEKV